jgi:hypothetical protein
MLCSCLHWWRWSYPAFRTVPVTEFSVFGLRSRRGRPRNRSNRGYCPITLLDVTRERWTPLAERNPPLQRWGAESPWNHPGATVGPLASALSGASAHIRAYFVAACRNLGSPDVFPALTATAKPPSSLISSSCQGSSRNASRLLPAELARSVHLPREGKGVQSWWKRGL